MHTSGIEAYYTLKNGKRLQMGYTTGTCAAAAAKAAAILLLTRRALKTTFTQPGVTPGQTEPSRRAPEAAFSQPAASPGQTELTRRAPETVSIMTPKGILLNLEILEPALDGETASCAIRKYSGDDPDVTDGILIYASARLRREPGVVVNGGIGIGRVTKPGLKQPVGAAAINPVPLDMIRCAAREVLEEFGETSGLDILIYAPEGTEIAKKTFNPRLGIEGGISILGTSGIVEPMSEAALLESIELELRQKYALGCRRLILTPGNIGADFLKSLCPSAENALVKRSDDSADSPDMDAGAGFLKNPCPSAENALVKCSDDDADTPGMAAGVNFLKIVENALVKCSNYIGDTLDMAANVGFPEVLLVGHIGKLVKLSGGILNTHSRVADGRAELMAACALRAGCSGDTAREILGCLTTDEMLRVLKEENLLENTMEVLGERIDFYLKNRAAGRLTAAAIVFAEPFGILCATGPAAAWLEEWKG